MPTETYNELIRIDWQGRDALNGLRAMVKALDQFEARAGTASTVFQSFTSQVVAGADLAAVKVAALRGEVSGLNVALNSLSASAVRDVGREAEKPVRAIKPREFVNPSGPGAQAFQDRFTMLLSGFPRAQQKAIEGVYDEYVRDISKVMGGVLASADPELQKMGRFLVSSLSEEIPAGRGAVKERMRRLEQVENQLRQAGFQIPTIASTLRGQAGGGGVADFFTPDPRTEQILRAQQAQQLAWRLNADQYARGLQFQRPAGAPPTVPEMYAQGQIRVLGRGGGGPTQYGPETAINAQRMLLLEQRLRQIDPSGLMRRFGDVGLPPGLSGLSSPFLSSQDQRRLLDSLGGDSVSNMQQLANALGTPKTAADNLGKAMGGLTEKNKQATGQLVTMDKELKQKPKDLKNVKDNVDLLSNSWIRHALWIAQGILLYQGITFAFEQVMKLLGAMIELERVSSRVAYVNAISEAQARAQLVAGTLESSRYGVRTPESLQGQLFARQARLSPETQQQAQQLAAVFGTKNYANVLEELYQVQRRLNSAGVENVNIMGFVATAMREVPVSVGLAGKELEFYFDALQNSTELSSKFGLTIEQTAILLGKVASATETSPERIATSFSALTERLRDPETKKRLTEIGLGYETVAEGSRKFAQATARLVQEGRLEEADNLMSALFGGTLQSPGRLLMTRNMMIELNQAFAESPKELANFDDVMTEVTDDTFFQIQRISASWDALVNSLSDITIVTKLFEAFNIVLEATATRFRTIGELSRLFSDQTWAGGLSQVMERLDKFYSERGLETTKERGKATLFNYLGFLMGGKESGPEAEEYFRDMMDALTGTITPPGQPSALGPTGQPVPVIPVIEGGKPTGFSIQDLPEIFGQQGLARGQATAEIEKLVAEARKLFSDTVAGYEDYAKDPDNLRNIFFYDERRKQIDNLNMKPLIATNEELRYAIEALTKEMKQITGVFNVPTGGEILVPFSALTAGFVPRQPGVGGVGGPSELPFRSADFPEIKVFSVNTALQTFADTLVSISDRLRGVYDTPLPSTSDRLRSPYDEPLPNRRPGNSTKAPRPAPDGGGGGPPQQVASLNTTVVVDGQVVQRSIQTRAYREIKTIARGSSVGGNVGGLVQ